MIRTPRAVPAPPEKPVRPGTAWAQDRARRLALRPGTWTADEAVGLRAEFDQAAAEWDDDRGAYRPPVLVDALARGGPFGGNLAVEIASGTGLLTPLIRAVWPDTVAVDLSFGMLSRAAGGPPDPGGRVPAAADRVQCPRGRCPVDHPPPQRDSGRAARCASMMW